ncbi:TrmB family transcriptional regulator [bacterium]|nr:TrmB family transcriptional regulator [bacterium]
MPDIIERLINIGLTKYEASVYHTLLQKPDLSATELANLASVPRTRVYEVINLLHDKGFCKKSDDEKIKKFNAINPKFAFNNLLERNKLEYEKRIKNINLISEELEPIFELSKEQTDDPAKHIEVIVGNNEILEKINEYGRDVKDEILTMNKAPYVIDFSAVQRRGKVEYFPGLKYKFVTEKSDIENEDFVHFLQLWEDVGAEVRVVDEVHTKLIVLDQRKVILSITNKNIMLSDHTSMFIDNSQLAKMYVKTFHSYFDDGIPLKEFLKTKKGE